MINACMYRDREGFIAAFTLRGHAETAEPGEPDLLCCAASTLAQTAIGALADLAAVEPVYHIDEDEGLITADLFKEKALTLLAPEQKQTAKIIMETLDFGLRQLRYSYPEALEVVYADYAEYRQIGR